MFSYVAKLTVECASCIPYIKNEIHPFFVHSHCIKVIQFKADDKKKLI
jgi:hypothetical protein